jgi:hypothetical protein
MPHVNYKIEDYKVTYATLSRGTRIGLTCERDFFGTLHFKPNGSTLPIETFPSRNHVCLYYHLDDFQNILDLLRNDIDSLYLFYGDEGTGYDCGISTGETTHT